MGSYAWRKCEIVLDVPEISQEVACGVLLSEQGRAWVDDFKFEEVDNGVATTDLLKGIPVLPEPYNLDFEQGNNS